jgi:uncharacterized protein (TIGR01777 family)
MHTLTHKKIVIAGANGFLGRSLSRHFLQEGWEVVGLVRPGRPVAEGCRRVEWDARVLAGWVEELEGAEVLVNLVGRSVNCRYNAANRAEILESRVESTRILGDAIALAARPPALWINSSTATIYRHAEDWAQDEVAGELGTGFSVEVATEWEKAFFRARVPGCVRKVAVRSALVLARERGTVFDYFWKLTRCGLGGAMAGGSQKVSWIHIEDYCRALAWMAGHDDLQGVVNLAAPRAVTNREMMREFRARAGMPLGLPAARWMLELGAAILGSESELLLKSRWVVPTRLLKHGFRFRWPGFQAALEDLAPRSLLPIRHPGRPAADPIAKKSLLPK